MPKYCNVSDSEQRETKGDGFYLPLLKWFELIFRQHQQKIITKGDGQISKPGFEKSLGSGPGPIDDCGLVLQVQTAIEQAEATMTHAI